MKFLIIFVIFIVCYQQTFARPPNPRPVAVIEHPNGHKCLGIETQLGNQGHRNEPNHERNHGPNNEPTDELAFVAIPTFEDIFGPIETWTTQSPAQGEDPYAVREIRPEGVNSNNNNASPRSTTSRITDAAYGVLNSIVGRRPPQ